jgi:hypothetical protein
MNNVSRLEIAHGIADLWPQSVSANPQTLPRGLGAQKIIMILIKRWGVVWCGQEDKSSKLQQHKHHLKKEKKGRAPQNYRMLFFPSRFSFIDRPRERRKSSRLPSAMNSRTSCTGVLLVATPINRTKCGCDSSLHTAKKKKKEKEKEGRGRVGLKKIR